MKLFQITSKPAPATTNGSAEAYAQLQAVGRWLTEQITWGERAGDREYVDILLRVKDRVNRQMGACRG